MDAESVARAACEGRIVAIRAVLATVPTAAYLCDVDGTITYFNRAAEALWGKSPTSSDRYCGSSALFDGSGKRVPHESSPTAHALRDRQAHVGPELLIGRPDGTRRRVLAYASPVIHADVVCGAVNFLMEIPGGAVEAQTKPGRNGATRPAEHRVATEQRPSVPRNIAKGGERILLVDDEPSMRWALAKHLGRLGYRVESAASGEDGLDLLKSGAEFELLLTDVTMRVVGGFELAETARRLLPGIGVILMSGAFDQALVGGNRFLTKPFELHVLLASIREALDAAARDGRAPPSNHASRGTPGRYPE